MALPEGGFERTYPADDFIGTISFTSSYALHKEISNPEGAMYEKDCLSQLSGETASPIPSGW